MRVSLFDMVIIAAVAIGCIAIVRGVKGETVHQLMVCRPGAECVKRGEPHEQSTSCFLDAASERLTGDVPTGTKVSCVRVKR